MWRQSLIVPSVNFYVFILPVKSVTYHPNGRVRNVRATCLADKPRAIKGMSEILSRNETTDAYSTVKRELIRPFLSLSDKSREVYLEHIYIQYILELSTSHPCVNPLLISALLVIMMAKHSNQFSRKYRIVPFSV